MLVEGRPGGANHDSRSPFFSLLSLTYSKALISSYFHYQTAGADRRGSWGCGKLLYRRQSNRVGAHHEA